jgi:P4 family phage/plasmid primase-like protien
MADGQQVEQASPKRASLYDTRIKESHLKWHRTLTDLGNAERFVEAHGKSVRYSHPLRRWYVYDGRRWRPDDIGQVERKMKATVRSIYAEAASAEAEQERKALADHAKKSEATKRITDALRLARSEEGIPILPEALDADPWLFNVENGTVDLRSGELREHRREDHITKLASVEFNQDAKAPRFLQFLDEIFDGDKGLISFVQRFAGYSLSGSTEERVFAILHGRGKNGKTTLVELVRDVMGDYAANTNAETILSRRNEGINNDVAALKGARFVSAAEVEQDRRLAESKVKNLTGTDTVTARFLYAEPFEFRPEFKLWLSTNNKPIIRGTDDAIWDRVRLIPFDQRFDGDRCDPKLPEKLRQELPGVLAWMVQGCLAWQREGLGEPEKVRVATEGYRAEQDVLAAFIEERCLVASEAWVKFADLYAAYHEWCVEAGENAETKRRLGNRLKERGHEPDRGTGNVPIRRGIGLRDDRHPGPEEGPSVTGAGDSYPSPTGVNHDRHAKFSENSYPSYPNSNKVVDAASHEESHLSKGNHGNYGNSSATPSDNDIESQRQISARGEAKEGNVRNTSINPSLSSSSTAYGGAGSRHVVVVGDGRLTSEQVEKVKRLAAQEHMSYAEARRAVLEEHDSCRRGFSDLSPEKGA